MGWKVKCDKCDDSGLDTVFSVGPLSMCKECYDYYQIGLGSDFRAFRRQVLLAAIASDTTAGTFDVTDDYIRKAWELADRIARAEPKE